MDRLLLLLTFCVLAYPFGWYGPAGPKLLTINLAFHQLMQPKQISHLEHSTGVTLLIVYYYKPGFYI